MVIIMSSKIRNCVKKLKNKEKVSEYLPAYVEESMLLHDHYARINLMMEYYMFYETISEGINPYIDSASDTAEAFHRLVRRFLAGPSREEAAQMAEELLALRAEVADKMQVLTAYVDCFVVYEYILNRVQYRFEDMEMLPGDEEFAGDLLATMFSSEDNVIISDNIRFAVGQLPMRMTRERFYDIIRSCVSLFQGDDVGSLEGFLYMFRTNAMLYQDENQKKYFTEFAQILDEMSQLDFDNITEELYTIYAEKISSSASRLNDVGDLYMQLGGLINDLYVLCAAQSHVAGEQFMVETDRVVRGINALFLQQDSSVWQQAGDTPTDSEDDKLCWLEEQFAPIEGKQEQIFESLSLAQAALEEIQEGYGDNIASLGLSGDFDTLGRLLLLTSNSIFADLEQMESKEKVTQEIADKAAAELIEECRAFFKGKSRMLRRAVMANTLEKMPVFFANAQEVADYVMGALSGCDDEAEKYASKLLLMDIMD